MYNTELMSLYIVGIFFRLYLASKKVKHLYGENAPLLRRIESTTSWVAYPPSCIYFMHLSHFLLTQIVNLKH
jgi:hypothetical protein